MKVAVGSTNPTKIAAVESVLGNSYQIVAFDAPSEVSEQPIGDQETIRGALNRAKACLTALDVEFAIGLEGGVLKTELGMMVINWGALVDRDGNEYIASGARAILPDGIEAELVSGKTLGQAMDIFTKRNGVSKKEGAMGVITNGRLPRAEMFAHVVKVLIGQYEFYDGLKQENKS